MTIRLKVLRRQEQRISKIKDLMEMFPINVPNPNPNQYYPIGGSGSAINDPRIEKTKNLFQMFHLL